MDVSLRHFRKMSFTVYRYMRFHTLIYYILLTIQVDRLTDWQTDRSAWLHALWTEWKKTNKLVHRSVARSSAWVIITLSLSLSLSLSLRLSLSLSLPFITKRSANQGWAEASVSTFSWVYILVYVQFPKNITKCFLKKSFFSAYFAMNLFYLHNLKT